jgi:hypothetical protein
MAKTKTSHAQYRYLCEQMEAGLQMLHRKLDGSWKENPASAWYFHEAGIRAGVPLTMQKNLQEYNDWTRKKGAEREALRVLHYKPLTAAEQGMQYIKEKLLFGDAQGALIEVRKFLQRIGAK